MSQNPRATVRSRLAPTRVVKGTGNENAVLKHPRQSIGGAQRVPVVPTKAATQRTALGELTTTTVNRLKQSFIPGGKDKESNLKVTRTSTTTSVAPISGAKRIPVNKPQPILSAIRKPNRFSSAPVPARPPLQPLVEDAADVAGHSEVEGEDDLDDLPPSERDDDAMSIEIERETDEANDEEVEALVNRESDEDDDAEPTERLEGSLRPAEFIWPNIPPSESAQMQKEVEIVREVYEDPEDMEDETMVSEYREEIFQYMHQLELEMMPDPDYMSNVQTEIDWGMRQTVVDWMLQVHMRYHLLGETLWIAVNILDRFLSKRNVSVVKLQLLAITSLFVAAKYEEILAPSVDEFVRMTENGYTRDEILKGERIVLQTLEFKISDYCSPYSWIRKLSKADDYSLQTRTLSKFLVEVTLLDHNFLRCKPSLIAAIGMFAARKILGGDWSEGFVYHAGYTEDFLVPGFDFLVAKMASRGFEEQNVSKKYFQKKFLRASKFAIEWSRQHLAIAEDSD